MLKAFCAWIAFIAGLAAGGDIEDAGSLLAAAVAGALLVWAGFAAADRSRSLSSHSPAARIQFAVLALAAGVALGVANLGANWLIAESDPSLRALLVARFTRLEASVALRPISLLGAPLVEEIVFRLFLMSAIAWALLRVRQRPAFAFVVALAASSFIFAALHLARPFPGDPALATFYRTTLVAKYTLAGVPLAWIFWRWGLPYSMLCHFAANAAHLVLQRYVFFRGIDG